MSESTPPRRIAPQAGPHLWHGAALSPADWMVPLGAEAGAEIEAALASPGHAMPRLQPLLAQVAERLAHGMGFCLLRGLPQQADPAALLGLLGSRMGRPLPPAEAPLPPVPADALLLLGLERAEVALESAAALHNGLMKADRAALEALYRPVQQHGLPVFAVHQGVFAARLDRLAVEPAARPALAALDAVAAEPSLALRMTLHPGDLLAINPFLVWPLLAGGGTQPGQGLAALPLLAEPSRLSGPYASLRPALP